MDLSADLFGEITTALAATDRDAPRAADRRSPRVRPGKPLAVCPWADPLSVLSLQVRDLSAGGVGLYHARRMALDERVVVRLPRADGETVAVLGRVVYWEPLAERLYAIGVHFDRVVTEAELSARVEPAGPGESEGVIGRLTKFAWPWRLAS